MIAVMICPPTFSCTSASDPSWRTLSTVPRSLFLPLIVEELLVCFFASLHSPKSGGRFQISGAMVAARTSHGLNSSLVNPLFDCRITDVQKFCSFRKFQQRHERDYTFLNTCGGMSV